MILMHVTHLPKSVLQRSLPRNKIDSHYLNDNDDNGVISKRMIVLGIEKDDVNMPLNQYNLGGKNDRDSAPYLSLNHNIYATHSRVKHKVKKA